MPGQEHPVDKQEFPPYVFAEFPKWVQGPDGNPALVASAAEEDALLHPKPPAKGKEKEKEEAHAGATGATGATGPDSHSSSSSSKSAKK